MTSDPIVDEVRDTRRQIFEECGNDLDRLIKRLKAAEGQDQHRLVTPDEVRKQSVASKAAVG